MTIVAGFRVREGVLLCADSMHSGSMKVHKEKISHFHTPGCVCAFALAGHEGFAKMAIEDCTEALNALPDSDLIWPKVKKLLRSTIKGINREYIKSLPIEERDPSRFDLLIAIKLKAEKKVRLLSTAGTARSTP